MNASKMVMSYLNNLTLDDVDKLVKILAIIFAGIGAYYKFFKGRVHISRLEPTVSGSVICKDGISYLLITAAVKNIGLSKVDITHDFSGLRIISHKPSSKVTTPQMVDWGEDDSAAVFDVFLDDPWVEPGETVTEQHLIAFPDCESEHFSFNVVLKIESRNSNWQANAIVNWQQNN